MNKDTITTLVYETPVGAVMLGAYGARLCMCDWLDGKGGRNVEGRLCRLLNAGFTAGNSALLEKAAAELDEYFAGLRREFDIPLLFVGTEFQKRVWSALIAIPYGTTVSYGEMARRIGMPKAVRAVANANGANPMSIFAPCHRVIGSDRSLTGYAGGLAAKEFLLRLEQGI